MSLENLKHIFEEHGTQWSKINDKFSEQNLDDGKLEFNQGPKVTDLNKLSVYKLDTTYKSPTKEEMASNVTLNVYDSIQNTTGLKIPTKNMMKNSIYLDVFD